MSGSDDTRPKDDDASERAAPDGGRNFEVPSGGYQRPDAEGSRAYDPGERRGVGSTGQFGLAEGAADEIAAPFDEERILDRVDRDHHGAAAGGDPDLDEGIAERVRERLAGDPHLDAAAIEVSVAAGEVRLAGTVASRSARRRAEDIAEAVEGVALVQNDLRASDPFYNDADRALPADTNTGHATAALPTGAGGDAATTSAGGVAGGSAGLGASGVGTGGDGLLGAEETDGRRRAKAPVDEGAP